MRTAKYIFELEKIFFIFIYIFMYTVLFCTINVVAQIDISTISIISIVTQILRNIIVTQILKRPARLGTSFLAI